MRWYTFFFLFLVEICTCLALSVIAKSFKASGRLGIDADSGSSAFGANESEDPSNEARQSLDNHESATSNNANEERGTIIAILKEIFNFEHKYQQVERVEYDWDEQLSRLLKVLSTKTTQSNHEGQLSSLPHPRDLFNDLHFTKADLKRDQIILWLKYFGIYGQKNGLRDNLKYHYEAFDLLMSIDGMDEKYLVRLLKKIKNDSGLKAFSNSMKDVIKQESRLHTLLKNDKNTPEAVFSELQVKVSHDDLSFLQWLRYCQLYKTKYMSIEQGNFFDGKIVGMLQEEKSLDELMQLFTSIRESLGLTTFADQLLTVTRKRQNAEWLKENRLPKAIYAHLIKADTPLHKQLPDFVQWLEYVCWFDTKHAAQPKTDVLNFLAPGNKSASLFYLATIFANMKSVNGFVKDAFVDIFEIMENQSVSPYELESLAKVYRWLNPNDPLNKSYDEVIASYSMWLGESNWHVLSFKTP